MINNTVLVGRLTKDPDLQYTPSGVAIAKFTLAVNRPFKSGDQDADFIPIVTFKKQAENVTNYLKKGSLVGVTGRIQTRNYEGQNGQRVYVTEVIAESVQFLDSKGDRKEQGNSHQQQNNYSQESNQQSYNDPFSSNSGSINIDDNDLPF